ncbi:peptidase inhibitor family I36 protein [Streptomyces sp. NPDC048710]|uniref:peptidase inhibitor family I36 protein n=1 Tax=unclassified Streptomyces TaxID=2593676 RepID=UPI00371B3420
MIICSLHRPKANNSESGTCERSPAAAADPNTCPKGKFCGWSGTNRTGTRTVHNVRQPPEINASGGCRARRTASAST